VAEKVTRTRFGHEAHIARVTELIGPPTTSPSTTNPSTTPPTTPSATATTSASPPSTTANDRPTVLFVSSNGAGMGHLTRLLSYARRADNDIAPHFLSMSQAAPVVADFGYPYEYMPSSKATGMSSRHWRQMFIERMVRTIQRVRPAVVVFDGTWPYEGVTSIRAACPEALWAWSRRGMWRSGMNRE